MKHSFRSIAALLALFSMISVSGCAISAALEEESGFKYNSSQVSAEKEIGEISYHEVSTPSYFGNIAAPSIFSDYTEKPYGIVEGDIYVSVSGNDETGDGTKANPYATIEKAQSVVRELKASGKLPSGTFTVSIMAGEYRISQGFKFTEEDSGTEDCQIIYAAYGDGEVIFKGTTKLDASDFTAVGDDIKAILPDESKDKVVMVDLTKYGITKDQLHIYAIGQYGFTEKYDPSYVGTNVELYFEREAFMLARWPNDGDFLEINGVVDSGNESSGAPAVLKLRLDAVERVKSWHSLDEIWVSGMFYVNWGTMSSKVSFDLDQMQMILDTSSVNSPDSDSAYIFYNVLDELDVPGEWYLDRENCILYMYPTKDIADAEIEFSCFFTDTMLMGDDVRNITFKGLNFMGGKGSGAEIENGESICFDRCKFYGFGGDYACHVDGYNNTVIECEAHYVASNGIGISGGEKATLKPSNSLMENCYVTNWGLVTQSFAVGLDLNGFSNTMRHCEAAYSQGNAAAVAQGNSICEYNLFHDCTTWASDCGTIYLGSSLYGSPNNQIRYNIFYNIGNEWARTAAVFLDEGHSHQRYYGNLFVNISGNGFTLGGGHHNSLMNNIIVNTGADAIYYSRAMMEQYHKNEWTTIIGTGYMWNNYAIVPKTQIWFDAIAYLKDATDSTDDVYVPNFIFNPAMSHISNNVIVNSANSIGNIFDQVWQYSVIRDNYVAKQDNSTLEAIFTDPANGDYRIKEDAPIFDSMSEFKDIPYHLVGRY